MNIEAIVDGPLFESIEYNMPFDAYRESPALNASTVKAAWKGKSISMLALKYAFENGREDTEAMLFGRALHCLMFEPDKFTTCYAAFDGRRDKRSKDYQDFLKDHAGAEVLKKAGQYSFDAAMLAAKAFLRNDDISELTEHGKGEVTIFTPMEGMQFRARLDWISSSAKCLVDMKTANDVSEEGFGRQFFGLHYDVQLGIYKHVFRKVTGHDWPTKVLAVENKPPHEVVVYEVPEAVLDQGWEKANEIVKAVKRCIDTKKWPGIAAGPVGLFIPAWEMEAQVEWDEELVQ